jgi:hypothetical protein
VGTTLQLIIGAGLFATILVFVAAFRFALRESAESRELACQPDLPRAAIHGGGPRWSEGKARARAARHVQQLQAVFIALGITGVFVMAVCMAGIVGLMIFG